jgi:hypothetical protein
MVLYWLRQPRRPQHAVRHRLQRFHAHFIHSLRSYLRHQNRLNQIGNVFAKCLFRDLGMEGEPKAVTNRDKISKNVYALFLNTLR